MVFFMKLPKINLAMLVKRLRQPENLLLLGILFVALTLRLWGIVFGLPYLYHYDERFYVNTALNLGAGVLNNPPYAATGLSNILFVEYAGYFVLGRLIGCFASAQEFEAAVRNNPTVIYLLARTTIAFMGMATVASIYYLARKTRDQKTGLIAATLLAMSFLHVRDSHYAVPDIAMPFFVVLALTLALVGMSQQKKHYIYWASLMGGLAVSMKWTGAIVALPVFWASMSISESKNLIGRLFNRSVFGGAALFVLGFAIGSPQILANPTPYLQEVLGQYQAGQAGGFEIWQVDSLSGWLFYGKTLLWGIGLPFLILSIIGLGRRLILALRGDNISILLLSFPLVYYLLMGATRHYFARYTLPLVPFLALFAAEAVVVIAARMKFKATRSQWIAMSILISIVVAYPLIASIRHNVVLTREDTRTQAKAWIEANVPEGARIAVDWSIHTPPLSTPERAAPFSDVVFDVTIVGGAGLSEHSLAWYESQGYDYLIATSYIYNISLVDTERETLRRAFYASLDQELELVRSFWPNATQTEPPFIFDEIYGPAMSLWQRERPGPVIRIYRLTP